VLSRTLSLTGSLPEAEDAVQDAVLRAIPRWTENGLPESPEAWLLTVAKNAHRDRLRKRKWEAPHPDALETLSQMSPWVQSAIREPDVARGWKDELLRLVFTCCHPSLGTGQSAALCLSTVVGLSSSEICAAFLTEPRTMEQRLTRARSRLKESGDVEGGSPKECLERLPAVRQVIHLLFNEGYWSGRDDGPIRVELCRLAIGLAHSLDETFPEDAESSGLLALLLFHEARRPARLDDEGLPVTLEDQDRSRWDHETIERGKSILDAALVRGATGPFQIEAAIAATHCQAERASETDWTEIASLYELLEEQRPTPAVRVNRAFAVGRARGAQCGLALLDDAQGVNGGTYPYFQLVRGVLLSECGQTSEARLELEGAKMATRNEFERQQIEVRLSRLERK
jgi:RNA polymerase sigma-70 factor (ECF subfamily)